MTAGDVAVLLGVMIGGLTGLTAFVAAVFRIAKAMADDVRAINRAVNHQDPGEPTLIDRVKKLGEDQAVHVEAAKGIAARVEVIETWNSNRHIQNQNELRRINSTLTTVLERLDKVEERQGVAEDKATERFDASPLPLPAVIELHHRLDPSE